MKRGKIKTKSVPLTYINDSPWIHQLAKIRKPKDVLSKDIEGGVVIVGGGIAGVSSAYFLLRDTKKKVTLVEGNKIAHGATGHNGGQIVSYFEKPFFQIVKEYGLELAGRGQAEILDGWNLLEQIYSESEINAYFSHFIGYAGCSSYQQLLPHLENKYLRMKAKINMDKIFISSEAPYIKKIPKKYAGCYDLVPQDRITSLLETRDTHYTAVLASKKGCLNSALFCEELVNYLLYKYKDRFNIFEFTLIDTAELYKDKVLLKTKQGYEIRGEKVILCTNGFEHIKIINKEGKDIDHSFHDLVYGVVGYMAGYLDKPNGLKSNALTYFPDTFKKEEDSYFYLTRREFVLNKKSNKILVSIGGPEVKLDDKREYNRERPYFIKRQKEIDDFLKKSYIYSPKKIKYKFHWHGLMGYTKTGLRCIGPHPINKNLLYNLGCNGVGLLPSIYGGYKIARFISGIKMKPSIFDVKP